MQQISINLPDDLLRFVQAAAERETRPVAMQIRHYVAEAARRAGWQSNGADTSSAPGDNPSGNPPLPVVTPDTLPAVRAELADLEDEAIRLTAAQRRLGIRFLPDDERRLSYIRSRAGAIRQHVTVIERSMGGSLNV